MCTKIELLISNRNLIQKVKSHDRVAQKQLYHGYVKLVSHIALRYVCDRHTAQDVVQNSFIRVFRNIEKFDENRGSLKSWIAKITVNEAIASLRSNNKIQFTSLDNPSADFEGNTDNDPLPKMELEYVRQVIDKLDHENRIVLDLFFFEEYSHKEIADLLQISQQSSRVKLHRAKKCFYDYWNKITRNEIQRTI